MKRFLTYLSAFLLVGLLGLQTAFAQPTTQARYVSYSGITESSVNLAWINGDGVGRVVVISTDATIDEPLNAQSTAYMAANGATHVAIDDGVNPPSGDKVVGYLTGASRTLTISNLAHGTQYWVKVFEFSGAPGNLTFATGVNTLNPRSFTTVTGAYGPFTTPVDVSGSNVNLEWASTLTTNPSWILSIYDHGSNIALTNYDYIDIGTLNAGTPKLYTATLPAGTYFARVRSFENNAFGPWITSSIFVVTPVDRPQIVQYNYSFTDGYVDIYFDRAVTPTINGMPANLEIDDFQVTDFTPNGGATGASVWKIENTSSSVKRLWVRFTGRATGAETFRIAPAATSIYAGDHAMDAADVNAANQTSPLINAAVATVLNTNTTFAYTTIAYAIEDATTVNGHTIQLKNSTPYEIADALDFNKELTLTDETAGSDGTNAIVNFGAGYFTLSSPVTISGITLTQANSAGTILRTQNVLTTLNGNTINYSGESLPFLYRVGGVIPSYTVTNNIINLNANAAQVGIEPNLGSVVGLGAMTITGNTFNLTNAGTSALKFNVKNDSETGAVALNISDNNFTGPGVAIKFFEAENAYTFGISAATLAIQGNTFDNTGLAIEFAPNVATGDFAARLPVINLGATNTNSGGMTITSKYVYSHATLDGSTYLYPGIAVLAVLNPITELEDGTGVPYNTVAAAIAASANDATQSVFLGQGTYTEAIALNRAVNLVGKGRVAASGTVLTDRVTVTAVATFPTTISNILFDVLNTSGIAYSVIPANSTINITDCAFDYASGTWPAAIMPGNGGNVLGNLIITGNIFTKKPELVNTAVALSFFDYRITGTVTISGNTFNLNSPVGLTDFAIYFTTTNGFGASDGDIFITGNTFTGTGDAILFQDEVAMGAAGYNLSTATINIYDGNEFNQSGYAIKVSDNVGNAIAIHTTMPAIDMFEGTLVTGDFGTDNFGLLAAELYGVAWRGDLKDETGGFLYPSIQDAINATPDYILDDPLLGLNNALRISRGTFDETVVLPTGSPITDLWGDGDVVASLLADGNTFTLEKDLGIWGSFYAPTVILGHNDAKLDDALALVKTEGTVSIAGGVTISGNANVSKAVTINEVADPGTYSGTLTIAGATNAQIDVQNLTLTGNPAINVNLTNGNTGVITIDGNDFTLINAGNGIVVETGNANSAGTFPLNIVGNSFTGGDATSNAINFRNQTTGFATFSAVNVYNSNVFNTPGYNFYKTNENNVCTYLPSVDVNATTGNTYTTTNTFGFFYSPASTTLVGEGGGTETETINTDCTAPAAFATGDVTTVTNTVAGYWNSDNTAIRVVVPIANDPSLEFGTVQVIASRDNWTTPVDLGTPQSILNADLDNASKYYEFDAATFEALGGFVEGDLWRFNAIITDFAGNATTGTASSTTITVDQTAPTVTLNSATADNIINIAEKAAGFNVNAQSNQANTTIYVVDAEDSPTWETIGTLGFDSGLAAVAATPIDIEVAAGEVEIVDGHTYNVYGRDLAGNVSIASVASFTADLTAPAAPTNAPAEEGSLFLADDWLNIIENNAGFTVRASLVGTNAVAGDVLTLTLTGDGAVAPKTRTLDATDVTTNGYYDFAIATDDMGTNGAKSITSKVTDIAGNVGAESPALEFTVDIIAPASPVIASRTAVTAPVVANYFNDDNTAIDVVVTIPNDDAWLEGGSIQIQARTNANGYENVGAASTTLVGELGTNKTFTIARTGTGLTDLDELAGWASGVTLDFLAVITDAAGNPTTGAAFGTTMNVDLVDPAAPTFVINASACINKHNMNAINIAVTGEANATVNYIISDTDTPANTITSTITLNGGGTGTIENVNLTTFADGTITITGTQTDLAGNVSVAGDDTETKNTDDAGITTLTLTSNNFLNMYAKDGQELTLAIDADEDVTVTAATIEGVNVLASLTNAGDADESTWNLTWLVAGMTTDNQGTFSITLRDLCGNEITFTQADLTGTNITYDNTIPVVNSIVRLTPTSEYTNSDAPVFRVTFSEPVVIENNNIFTFSGTCTGTPVVASSTGFDGQLGLTNLFTTWDVTIGGVANENGTLELELDANLTNVIDKASNSPAAYTDGEIYIIDNVLPAIAVTTPTYDGSRITSISQMQGTYSDANGVTGGNVKVSIFKDANANGTFDVGEFYWDGTGFTNATEQLLIANRTGNNLSGNWTYNIDLTGELAESQFVLKAYATDVATNVNSATRVFVVDPIPPQVVSITKQNDNTILLVFNEDVDENWTNVPPGPEGNALATFYAVSGTINGTPFGPINPSNATRAFGGLGTEDQVTLVFAGTPFAGIVQCDEIDIVVTGVRDVAGNIVDATHNTATYIEPDVTAPFVTSVKLWNGTGNDANETLTNAETVTYEVTFSEAVQGVTTTSFDFTGTEATNAAFTSVAAANTGTLDDVWYVTVTPTVNVVDGGTLGIAVKAAESGITDDACGHADNAFDQNGNVLTANHTYKVDKKVPVIVNSDPDWLFTAPSSVATTYWNGGDKTIAWTPGRITDGSGLATDPIKLEYSLNGTDGWETIVAATANDGTHIWTFPNDDNSTTARIRLSATDAAGNVWSELSAPFVIDNTPPTVESIVITPNNAPLPNEYKVNNATTSITVAVTFDEEMKTAVEPDLQFTEAFAANLTADAQNWNVENTVFTRTYTVDNAAPIDGEYTLTVTAAQDLAGNVMTQADLNDVKVDQVEPTLANVAILSDNALNPGDGTNAGYAKVGDDVTVTFTASENIQTPTVTIAIQPATESENSANPDWKGVYQMTVNEATGVVPFTVNFNDLAGNAGTEVTAVSGDGAGSSITFDKTAPTFTIDAPLADAYVNGTQPVNISAITDDNEGTTEARIGTTDAWEAFVSSALINTLSGWDAMAADGEITIYVRHTDLAGNETEHSVEVTKDTEIPTLSITRVTPVKGDKPAFYTSDNTVAFILNFSEVLEGFDVADITINKGTGTVTHDAPVLTGPDANHDYTLTFNNVAGDGPLGITVNKAGFSDRAGNKIAEDVTCDPFTIDNTPPTITELSFECDNTIANIEFSEDVYSTSNASGNLSAIALTYNFVDPDGDVQVQGLLVAHTEGTDNATITLTLQKNPGTDIVGNETFEILSNGPNRIFDKAGNSMIVEAKEGIMKVTPPAPTVVNAIQAFCEGSIINDLVADAGANVVRWFAANSSEGTPLIGDHVLVHNTTYYGFAWNDACYSNTSVEVTVNITPATSVTSISEDVETCFGAVNTNFTVVAAGASLTYQWQYETALDTWADVVNGTPANATYTGDDEATLTIAGNIAAGEYTFRVFVDGQCGDATSDEVILTVRALPTITLATVTDNNICVGEEVTFSATASADATVVWYDEATDGNIVTDIVDVELPVGTTTYYAEAQLNGCVSAARTPVAVTVNAPPIADASVVGATTVCEGTVVQFTTPEVVGAEYLWEFPDESSSTDREPTFNTTGRWGVKTAYLTVTSADDCDSQSDVTFTVNKMPNEYNVTGGPLCSEVTVTVNLSNSEAGMTYQLYKDNVAVATVQEITSVGGPIEFTVPNAPAGVYTIKATNGTCVDVAMNGNVTVLQSIVAPTADAVTHVYDGAVAAELVATGGVGSAFRWYSDAELTELVHTGASFAHGRINAGVYTYYVTQQPIDGCESPATAVTVTITPAPVSFTLTNNVYDYDGTEKTAIVTPTSTPALIAADYSVVGNTGTNADVYPITVTLNNNNFNMTTPSAIGDLVINKADVSFALTNNEYPYNGTLRTATVTPTSTPALIPADYSVDGNTATNAGTYPITVTLNNNNFNMTTPSAIGDLVINKVNLLVGVNNEEICFGEPNPVEFTIIYEGLIGPPSSLDVQPVAAIDNDQIIFTTLAQSNNYNITHVEGTFTVHALPIVTITPNNNTPAMGNTVTYTTEGMMFDYDWTIDGGELDTDYTKTGGGNDDNSITITWLEAGSYTVSVNYENANGCTAVAATDLAVTVTAGSVAPSITGAPADAEVCDDENVTFSVTAVNGNPAPDFVWEVNTGSGWTEIPASADQLSWTINNVTVAMSGYQYRLKAENSVGTVYSAIAILTVNAPVTPAVSIELTAGDNPTCAGQSVTFTATATNGGTPNYQWFVGGNPVADNTTNMLTIANPTVTADVYVVMTTSLTCVTDDEATSNTITLNVNNVPAQPSVITGDDVVCAGTNGVTYSVTNVAGVDYAWTYSGTNATLIQNGTNEVTINFAANATTGILTVTPSNTCGDGTTSTLAITVNPVIAITAQPANVTATTDASFTVGTNVVADSYQWEEFNGTTWSPITDGGEYSGATTATLTINPVAGKNGYKYRVTVSGCGTDVTSNGLATLSVQAAVPTTQATLLYVGRSTSSLTFHFTPGNGTGRVAFIKEAGAPKLPEFSERNDYTNANSIYSSAPVLSDGSRVVYYGDGTSVMITGLTRNKTYTITVYEYNIVGNDINTINFNTDINTATVNQLVQATNRKEAIDENELLGETFHIKRIWPNPVSNEINLEVNTDEAARFEFELYNTLGEIVYARSMDLSGGNNAINLHLTAPGQLSAGQYNLRVRKGADYIDQQIIIMP